MDIEECRTYDLSKVKKVTFLDIEGPLATYKICNWVAGADPTIIGEHLQVYNTTGEWRLGVFENDEEFGELMIDQILLQNVISFEY